MTTLLRKLESFFHLCRKPLPHRSHKEHRLHRSYPAPHHAKVVMK